MADRSETRQQLDKLRSDARKEIKKLNYEIKLDMDLGWDPLININKKLKAARSKKKKLEKCLKQRLDHETSVRNKQDLRVQIELIDEIRKVRQRIYKLGGRRKFQSKTI